MPHLPIPRFFSSDKIDDQLYYAVTQYVDGTTLDQLKQEEFTRSLGSVRQNLAAVYRADISDSKGYGNIDFTTGDGLSTSWTAAIRKEVSQLNQHRLEQHAVSLGLALTIVERLYAQIKTNLPFVSETRRLLHGDPGGGNMIVRGDKVVGKIDWEQVQYGDWARDFSRFEYWGQRDYGDMKSFGEEFQLETDYLKERKTVYWSLHSLRNIEFAYRSSNKPITNWLLKNVERTLADKL